MGTLRSRAVTLPGFLSSSCTYGKLQLGVGLVVGAALRGYSHFKSRFSPRGPGYMEI